MEISRPAYPTNQSQNQRFPFFELCWIYAHNFLVFPFLLRFFKIDLNFLQKKKTCKFIIQMENYYFYFLEKLFEEYWLFWVVLPGWCLLWLKPFFLSANLEENKYQNLIIWFTVIETKHKYTRRLTKHTRKV